MGSKLESSALIFGILGIMLFLFPYVMYAKEAFDENNNNKDYLSIIGKVVGMHLVILFFAISFTSIIEITMSYRPEMTPSRALSLFYATDNGDWKNFINYLLSYGATQTEPTTDAEDIVKLAYSIVMNYLGLFLALFLILIPTLTIFFAVSVGLKQDEQARKTTAEKISTAYIIFIFITVLVWIHAALASAYISIFTGSDFSFYTIMSTLWHEILVQGST